MTIEELDAYRRAAQLTQREDYGEFLLREGLDLLSAFRSIKNSALRQSILKLVATAAQGEREREEREAQ